MYVQRNGDREEVHKAVPGWRSFTHNAGRLQREKEFWTDQCKDSAWSSRSKCQRNLARMRRISALARLRIEGRELAEDPTKGKSNLLRQGGWLTADRCSCVVHMRMGEVHPFDRKQIQKTRDQTPSARGWRSLDPWSWCPNEKPSTTRLKRKPGKSQP